MARQRDLGRIGVRSLTMLRHVWVLVSLGASIAVLPACGGDDAGQLVSGTGSDLSTRTRAIDRALFVDAGRKRVLYAVRGIHYGTVGRFVVSCSRAGVARTVYALSEKSPDSVVAVEGRGSSRATKLRPGRVLPGGSRRSGIEEWIVLTGGKPESIRLDASLLVRPEPALGCEFTMRGSVAVTPH